MKVAIVHDWLTGMRGGEKCLEVFCELFPEATIFTLLHNKGSVSKIIESMDIKTSFIQHLPKAPTKYRSYLPLFPKAIESFDLSGYELILSSSHCVAKGIRKPKDSLHVCYCYTPMRYAWMFYDEYFGNLSIMKRMLIKPLLGRLRRWDLKTNEGVDFFIAISDNIKDRISNCYSRDSYVIYPPVDIDRFSLSNESEDFYLIVSALVPYKRVDLAVDAFNQNGKRLLIIGTGNSQESLKKKAKNNIEFLGWSSDDEIAGYYKRCKALIFPGEEDFGIVPVEAQACGKPVIAYAKGGALETVVGVNGYGAYDCFTPSGFAMTEPAGRQGCKDLDSSVAALPQNDSDDSWHKNDSNCLRAQNDRGGTGVFFYEQTKDALLGAIELFEKNSDKFNPENIRDNALRFDRNLFKDKISKYIQEKINEKKYQYPKKPDSFI
jgi:glycosyltransferase involved in cell wall biosynthesis